MKRLYLRILTGKADAEADKSLQTTASLGTGEVDFGRFPYGEEQVREVTLRNTGAAALAIHGIDTSCGCTRVVRQASPSGRRRDQNPHSLCGGRDGLFP